MARHWRLVVASFVALAAASCADTGKPKATASAPPPPAPSTAIAQTAVKSQSCVDLQRIRESRVRSDKVIDFVMIDGSILRNTLPNSCPQLGFERAFTYATSLSQLCSVDIITVIIQGGGPSRGASCGLGQFTPVSLELAKAPMK